MQPCKLRTKTRNTPQNTFDEFTKHRKKDVIPRKSVYLSLSREIRFERVNRKEASYRIKTCSLSLGGQKFPTIKTALYIIRSYRFLVHEYSPTLFLRHNRKGGEFKPVSLIPRLICILVRGGGSNVSTLLDDRDNERLTRRIRVEWATTPLQTEGNNE